MEQWRDMSKGWALLVQPLCRRSQTLSSCHARLCVLKMHTPGSGLCLWNGAQPRGRAGGPPCRAVLGCTGCAQSRAEAVDAPPREPSTTAAKVLGVRQLSSRCQWQVWSKPCQGGSLQRGVTHVYPGCCSTETCWSLALCAWTSAAPVPAQPPNRGVPVERRGSWQPRAQQSQTCRWPPFRGQYWVSLRTRNSPCICGPCQASPGASVQVPWEKDLQVHLAAWTALRRSRALRMRM